MIMTPTVVRMQQKMSMMIMTAFLTFIQTYAKPVHLDGLRRLPMILMVMAAEIQMKILTQITTELMMLQTIAISMNLDGFPHRQQTMIRMAVKTIQPRTSMMTMIQFLTLTTSVILES